MLCSLSITACKPTHVAEAIPIPPERLDCVATTARPALPPEYVIDWVKIGAASSVPLAVEIAKGEVAKLVASFHRRDGVVAGYILEIEGKLFACSNDAEWIRDYQAKVPVTSP